MAEITYEPTEWADFEQGGTPITAASLNHMEGGIAGAIRGVNTLTEDRLQTYRVSQDGDTATQDVSGNAIVGPCLIYDEAINGTYYEPSSDVGDRVLMVSANQIKALQDSVSRLPQIGEYTGPWSSITKLNLWYASGNLGVTATLSDGSQKVLRFESA